MDERDYFTRPLRYELVIEYDDGSERKVGEWHYRRDAARFGEKICDPAVVAAEGGSCVGFKVRRLRHEASA